MRIIRSYYRLIILDSVEIFITTICGIILTFNNLSISNITELIILGFILPIAMSLLLTVLDVAFISHRFNINKMRILRLTKAQRHIARNINAFSSLIMVISLMMAAFMYSISAIYGVISYSSLLVLCICHYCIANK